MEEIICSRELEANKATLGKTLFLNIVQDGRIYIMSFDYNNALKQDTGSWFPVSLLQTIKRRIPKSFIDEFGKKLQSDVILHCNSLEWKAKYDHMSMVLYGMRRFMRFYGVKIYNLLQLDYYGENMFVVKIFKDTATECNYQSRNLEEFLQNEDLQKWKKEKYVLDRLSLEYEKVCAIWMFNAVYNYAGYFQIKINNLDIDPKQNQMTLKLDLHTLYKNWKDGSVVSFMFVDRRWEINVERRNENCTLGTGWQEFANEADLESGDTLVLFKISSSEENLVNVCIFKDRDKILGFREDSKECTKSFFIVISEDCLEEGMLVVPKLVKETYGEVLRGVNEVQIAGERGYMFFSIIGGYLANIVKILEVFHVSHRETIIFSFDNKVLQARVYQEDGKEIDYSKRLHGCLLNDFSNWIWAIDWIERSGKQNGNGNSGDTDKEMELAVGNNKMEVDVAVFPQFIIVIRADNCESTTIELPEKFISEYGGAIPEHVTFKFRTGRETHVQYSVTKKSFVNLIRFRKELLRCCASFIVFCYKGNGIFSVNILSDDGTEAENVPMRNISMDAIYNRDKNKGIGWRFLSFGVSPGINSGEIEIPESFVKRFGDVIPRDVKVVLQNGALINAYYSKTNRKLIGLLDIIDSNHFEKKDCLLFTFRGDGIFDVVIFDKTKMEKMLQTTTSAKEVFAGSQTTGMQIEGEVPLVENEGHLHEIEHEDQVQENVQENAMEMADLVDPVEFTATLTTSNVNSSSHGVYIPRYITPANRNWKSGEKVILTTTAGSWSVGIIASKGIARFSAGWNTFAEANKVEVNQQMMFTLVEEAEGIAFNVHVQ